VVSSVLETVCGDRRVAWVIAISICVSRILDLLVHCVAVNIRFLFTLLKQAAGSSFFRLADNRSCLRRWSGAVAQGARVWEASDANVK
jgi:hypothetical protein